MMISHLPTRANLLVHRMLPRFDRRGSPDIGAIGPFNRSVTAACGMSCGRSSHGLVGPDDRDTFGHRPGIVPHGCADDSPSSW
jgi:hypothetical protein